MIRGLVQGVGFRPFVCRLALKHGLLGEVDNRTDGVSVLVQGDMQAIDRFSNDLLQNAPPASHIKSIEINPATFAEYDSFRIAPSRNIKDHITEVSPDIAVCDDCLVDMEKDPGRIDYPFINCTNCGPRFTIIEALPYDRPQTSMKSFPMCSRCETEYNDILNRRFHAQPVACNNCGPVLSLRENGRFISGTLNIIKRLSELISEGKIAAVKGLGGYFLMCDAFNDDSVRNLRKRKNRDAKPFAVMFRDITEVKRYCFLDSSEEKELTSWRRPVMILKQRAELAPSVSNGLGTTGALLPYMPLHYLMFRSLKTSAVVLTSGNISDDPIITDDTEAISKLSAVADAFLVYDREIINRADDSVIRMINRRESIIRRSRGYVPRPVDLSLYTEGIMALGAEQKNSFCIGKGSQAIVSQYIGDLKNLPAFEFFTGAIKRLSDLFRFTPAFLACDMHPDYLSTRHAEDLEQQLNIPLLKVQHHHAHIASCMAESGIDEEVIGFSFDGTGYGPDGNIWGSECIVADLLKFRRISHFDYIPMPGGDKCVSEPWRMAFSYLYSYFGDNFDYLSIPVFRSAGRESIDIVRDMIVRKINSPLTSGAGRLFDAVAALTGLCPTATFDSEGPMRLESAIDPEINDAYPFTSSGTISFRETFRAILEDMQTESVQVIAARFHNTIVQTIIQMAKLIRQETSLNKVMLSGGVFQNKYLLERTTAMLRKEKFRVFTNHLVPANDGGISLGQLAIASKRNKNVS